MCAERAAVREWRSLPHVMGVEYRGGNFGGGSLKHLKVKHFEGERLITKWCAIASTYLSVRLQYGIFFFLYFSVFNSCSSNPCRNGGHCLDNGDGTYNCSCNRPYTGENCQESKY